MPFTYKISLDVVQQLLQLGRDLDLPVDEVLDTHAIDLNAMEYEPAYMSATELERLLAISLRMINDPLPGLVAAGEAHAAMFGLVGFLVHTASTVEAYLNALIQVEALIGNVAKTSLCYGEGEASLIWDCRLSDPYVATHVADFIFYANCAFVLSAGNVNRSPIQGVYFKHAPPDDEKQVARYREIFTCPVYFDQPDNRIVLFKWALDLPLPSANPSLNEVLTLHARQVLAERRCEPSFVDEARVHLLQLIHQGEANKERLAETMDITSRTLHRKLQDAGTNFTALHDQLRLQRACALLEDGFQNIQQIALSSGFQEPHSFTRWFRKHTQMTPSEYRKKVAREACEKRV